MSDKASGLWPEEHKFRFPVGDWSDDGHGKCEYFIVKSNAPVEKWRAAYFAAIKKFKGKGLIPDSYNRDDSEGRQWDNGWPLHKMREATGFDFPNTELEDKDIPEVGHPDPEDVVGYTLKLCQMTNKKLEFEIANESVPIFPFCGFDKKDRHIGQFGYEIFMDW